ncbi:MAG: hypothetical protein SXV54_26255, partial [Chloroflexota bacterium]|nr:hypothetical protein [Chloroflexota bacterium]
EETTQPFTITMQYTDTREVGEVVIAWWDPHGKWLPLPTQVNTATQTATALGTRFTVYAVGLLSPAYVLPQRAIVVDDMSAGFVTYGTPEYWHVAPPADGIYYAGQTHWTRNSKSTQYNWATWTPPTSLDGNYLVCVFVPSNYADTQHASYEVHHNNKVTTIEIDQTQYIGDWACPAGQLFDFTAGTSSYVLLDDVTGEQDDSKYIAFDAIAFISAAVDPPPGAIVVDDVDSGFVISGTVGNWHTAPPEAGIYYAGQTHWTRNVMSAQDNWATWTPSTPLDGPYQVYAFVPSNYADTEQAIYYVYHNGRVDNVGVNQSIYLGDWISLGVFDFTASTDGYVFLSDVTWETDNTRYIAFDAVAFVPNNVYLPLVIRNYPLPPPMKQQTGIHLGSRQDVWPDNTLQKIDGRLTNGVWPRAVVVQSDQLYILDRRPSEQDPLCPIAQARVRLGDLHNYLTEAQRNGVIVIIRITPSPGNFEDWENSAIEHVLNTGTTPVGDNYCWSNSWPDPNKQFGYQYFRAIDDVATEIHEIYKLNTNQDHQWNPANFFFEPANEPNKEWYEDWLARDPEAWARLRTPDAWTDMDSYFLALYDHVKSLDSNIQVLTPPMAQGLYAETRRFISCEPMTVSVSGQSGYAFMPNTFATKSDGYSWHNYWRQGKEMWVSSGNPCPASEHVLQYFPTGMQTTIMGSSKPAFITEADLFSPCQESDNPITDKDSQAVETRQSLWQFVSQEQGADYVVAWLLTEYPYSIVEDCHKGGLTNYEEIRWHQAYEDDVERGWFGPWWSGAE